MVSYRSSPPPNEILCGDGKAEFKSPALKCQTCKIYYHPICAEMPLYYMIIYARSSLSFVCIFFARKNRQNLIGQRQYTCSRIATTILST